MAAQLRACMARVHPQLRRPRPERRQHRHPGVRPRRRRGLSDHQGRRRSHPPEPALVHARARPGHGGGEVRLPRDDPGHPVQRPHPVLPARVPDAASWPAAARRGGVRGVRRTLRRRALSRLRGRRQHHQPLGDLDVGDGDRCQQQRGRHLAVRRGTRLGRSRPDLPHHRQRRQPGARPRQRAARHARGVRGPAAGAGRPESQGRRLLQSVQCADPGPAGQGPGLRRAGRPAEQLRYRLPPASDGAAGQGRPGLPAGPRRPRRQVAGHRRDRRRGGNHRAAQGPVGPPRGLGR